MSNLPVTRVVLYKHGVGYFEREGTVDGDAALALTFKQSEVSDVLKSLTVLDLDGGHVAAVSYDSTKPIDQLLSEIALSIPDDGAIAGLLPQLKGARVAVQPEGKGKPAEGSIIGVDVREGAEGAKQAVLSVLGDDGDVMSFDLYRVGLQLLDAGVRRDLDFYLKTQLSAKKKDARTFTLFAQGEGTRTVRLSYVLEAPVWKATYRIMLNATDEPPLIQGWAVVDNMQDEDWEGVQLSLVAGLPVSFVHDLYTPRYIRRPVIAVKETTGVLPPELEYGVMELSDDSPVAMAAAGAPQERAMFIGGSSGRSESHRFRKSAPSSVQTQVRERQIGDLFEYEIERPVTVRRNQSALVPIVLKPFNGRTVLLYQKASRAENPMRCVEFENTTGLTLEGGPVTVLEDGSYVGEAMLDTMKPSEQRLVPYAVELGVRVTDRVNSQTEKVSRVVVQKGTLKTHFATIDTTTYTFINKSDRDYVVYLDHPRPNREEKLTDTPSPHEVTDNYWRFRFVLPKNETAQYPITWRRTHSQAFALIVLESKTLAAWIDQKYVDAATQAVMREIVQHRASLDDLERQVAALVKERETIHAEQKRIRENLQSLGDRASEKELRERFVRTLNTQEDRLEQIVTEFADRAKQQEAARKLVEEAVSRIDVDAAV